MKKQRRLRDWQEYERRDGTVGYRRGRAGGGWEYRKPLDYSRNTTPNLRRQLRTAMRELERASEDDKAGLEEKISTIEEELESRGLNKSYAFRMVEKGWAPDRTRDGRLRARGTGEHAGQFRYGEAAERALRQGKKPVRAETVELPEGMTEEYHGMYQVGHQAIEDTQGAVGRDRLNNEEVEALKQVYGQKLSELPEAASQDEILDAYRETVKEVVYDPVVRDQLLAGFEGFMPRMLGEELARPEHVDIPGESSVEEYGAAEITPDIQDAERRVHLAAERSTTGAIGVADYQNLAQQMAQADPEFQQVAERLAGETDSVRSASWMADYLVDNPDSPAWGVLQAGEGTATGKSVRLKMREVGDVRSGPLAKYKDEELVRMLKTYEELLDEAEGHEYDVLFKSIRRVEKELDRRDE